MTEKPLQDALHTMISRFKGMTITEALTKSKELGDAPIGRKNKPGWIRYLSNNTRNCYYLTAEDLLAEDWELRAVNREVMDFLPVADLAS